MVEKHIMELFVEADKKLSAIVDTLENANPPFTEKDKQKLIDATNDIIRQLDAVVEKLETH